MLTLHPSRKRGTGDTLKLRLSWEAGRECRAHVAAKMTYVIQWASWRAQNTMKLP